MKQWVVLCLMTLVAFSGCIGDDEGSTPDAAAAPQGDDGAMEGSMDNGTEDGNGTDDGSGEAPVNTPPVVEAFDPNRTEGEVPFDVRFDFNASDADGDELSWTLDADGDGTADSEGSGDVLPFNFTFTFDVAGTYNATLNVTDGTNSTSATVTITASEPEEEEEEENEGEEEEGRQQTGEDDWAVFYNDGTCDAKGAVSLPSGHYIHERGDPPGTGFILGAGTWVYEESNGIEGMQISGSFEGGTYANCINGDTGVF